MMQEDGGPGAVASVIDRHLAPTPASEAGLGPVRGFERPLILTTMRWFSAARLADSLLQAGYTVSSCRPRGHPMDAVDGMTARPPPESAVEAAFTARRHPERSTRHHSSGRRALAVAASAPASDIGTEDPELQGADRAFSRSRLGDDHLARRVRDRRSGPGYRRAGDGRITSSTSSWPGRPGGAYPIVLKSDGSWGGAESRSCGRRHSCRGHGGRSPAHPACRAPSSERSSIWKPATSLPGSGVLDRLSTLRSSSTVARHRHGRMPRWLGPDADVLRGHAGHRGARTGCRRRISTTRRWRRQ